MKSSPAAAPPTENPRVAAPRPAADVPDRLAAEVRDSVVLLLLSVLVTAGVAAAASALLTVLS